MDEIGSITLNQRLLINTINPHSYITAKKDAVFKKALLNSTILLPDGIGIQYAAKQVSGKKIKKIAGADIHFYLLNLLNTRSGKVFYMGSSSTTLQLITEKLKREYSNILVSSYSPPFKAVFSEDENGEIISHINTFKPDILFIGMTAPKQEKWVFENQERINARIICSIGAVFDFYAGTIKRPPNWMIRLKLEWLGRLLNEPKRMWKRNFISTPIFIKDVLFTKLNKKK